MLHSKEDLMKYSRHIFTVITILVTLVGLQGPGVLSQEPKPFTTTIIPNMSATIDIENPEAIPGLEYSLTQLVNTYKAEGPEAAQALGSQGAMVMEGNQVQVVVVGESDADMDAIRPAITG